MCMLWLFYTREWASSETIACLRHVCDARSIAQKLQRLQASRPIVEWKVECYHTVRSGGPSPAQKRTKRVVTHRAKKQYAYDECSDISLRVEDLRLEEHPLVTLRIEKGFGFGDAETQRHFEREKSEFKKKNNTDRHQTFTESMRLSEAFDVHQLVEAPGGRSFFIEHRWAVLFSCLLCSPCYREWIKKKIVPRVYRVEKRIYKTV